MIVLNVSTRDMSRGAFELASLTLLVSDVLNEAARQSLPSLRQQWTFRMNIEHFDKLSQSNLLMRLKMKFY